MLCNVVRFAIHERPRAIWRPLERRLPVMARARSDWVRQVGRLDQGMDQQRVFWSS